MVEYYCKKCDIKTDLSECPNCHERTELSSSVFWCEGCKIPLYEAHCPLCGHKAKRISSDIRPVFPEERLMMEIVLGTPLKYKNNSVWSSASNYYLIDGKRVDFSISDIQTIGADRVREELEKYSSHNSYDEFDAYIEKFIKANQGRCNYITSEACAYIRNAAKNYGPTEMFVSMSGGKDSTVVSSLVRRALSSEDILHIYGDTTLEFPETKKYIDEFKRVHPKTPLLVAINKDKDFEELCTKLGPPSRVMRWCCTIFKTGAIQRKISTLFRNKKQVLTFMGLRRNESNSRSKYDRDANSPKITIQKTSCPIIDWFDFDIWLYLLTNKVEFNQAYKLGYNNQTFEPEKYKVDQIKKKAILDIDKSFIHLNCEKVIKAIDRAFFFLQTRCGVRSINEIKYNLMIVLISTVFLNDDYFVTKKYHALLEAWYWSVLFGGEFDKEQNKNVIKHLNNLFGTIKGTKDTQWLKNMVEKDVFKTKYYSDEDLLTMKLVEDDRYPRSTMQTYICQFQLAKTYPDLFDGGKKISTFYEGASELEMHHIVPLGSVATIKESTNTLRENKKNKCNSPLNFILITKEDNLSISSKSLPEYVSMIKTVSLSNITLQSSFPNDDLANEQNMISYLKNRFSAISGEVVSRINDCIDLWAIP